MFTLLPRGLCYHLLVSFPSLWQTTFEKQLKGGKAYFGSQFQWFQSIWLHHWFLCETERLGGEYVVEEELLTSWQEVSGEKERKGLGTINTLQGHTPTDLLPSTRPHLQQFPPSLNSATSWGLSLQHMSLWGMFQIQTLNTIWHATGGRSLAYRRRSLLEEQST